MKYYEDPILGKGRALDVTGGTGGGTTYIGGFAIGISGDTISRLRYMPIESVTGNSVTLQAGHAYKAYATSTAITLNTETVPEGQFGMEGHIEIYVSGTGYVVTGTNVVLANALEPDSVNNCTLRFHDGVCIISVEDHVAGYIVVNGSTSGEGSLYYGIATSTNDYVAFDASLNGQVIPLAGATAEGEKHLVGNGYTETTLTGAVNCGTSAVVVSGVTTHVPYKVTVANLSLSNVQVVGGVMTLGDAFIPSGSTVAVSGGGLAVEKVTGAGSESVINLGGTQLSPQIVAGSFNGLTASGVTITNGYSTSAGGVGALWSAGQTYSGCVFSGNIAAGAAGCFRFTTGARGDFANCQFVSNTAGTSGGGIVATGTAIVNLSGCTFSGNIGSNGVVIAESPNTIVNVNDCKFDTSQNMFALSNTVIKLNGSNATLAEARGNGSYILTSGAILDLTGNTNATPIAPGGGITFEAGGATVKVGDSTASSSYMMDNVTLPAGAKLTNTAVVDLGGGTFLGRGNVTGVELISGSAYVSGGGITSNVTVSSAARLYLQSGGMVTAVGTTIKSGGYFFVYSGCTASNTVMDGGYTYVYVGGTANNTTVNGGRLIVDAGTANGVTINSGGTTTVIRGGIENEPIISSGGFLVVSSGGSALLVTSNAGAIVTVEDGGYITYKE